MPARFLMPVVSVQARNAVAMSARPECKGTMLITAFDHSAKRTQARLTGSSTGRTWQERVSDKTPPRRPATTTSAHPRSLCCCLLET